MFNFSLSLFGVKTIDEKYKTPLGTRITCSEGSHEQSIADAFSLWSSRRGRRRRRTRFLIGLLSLHQFFLAFLLYCLQRLVDRFLIRQRGVHFSLRHGGESFKKLRRRDHIFVGRIRLRFKLVKRLHASAVF